MTRDFCPNGSLKYVRKLQFFPINCHKEKN